MTYFMLFGPSWLFVPVPHFLQEVPREHRCKQPASAPDHLSYVTFLKMPLVKMDLTSSDEDNNAYQEAKAIGVSRWGGGNNINFLN